MQIKPYEKNAKKHPPEQVELIARSIARFGWRQPISLGLNGVIVVGHGRWTAYQEWGDKLGMKEPWIVDGKGETISGGPETRKLTELEEKAYRLADNQINALSGNDSALLLPELRELDLGESALFDLTGFDRKLILVDDAKGDTVPGIPTEPKSRLGDVYELGSHRVICGDSTKSEDLVTLMNGQKADMIFTDPPYGVSYVGKTKDALKIENDSLNDEELEVFLEKAFVNGLTSTKTGSSWYVAAPAGPLHQVFGHVLKKLGIWRQTINWVKDAFVMGRSDYHYRHEPIFYGWSKGASHTFHGGRDQDTIWDIPRPKQSKEHPTMKPVALVEKAILNSSKEEDIILDLFLGGGSTLIASEHTGRTCYGVEFDPKYVDVIVQRYVDFTGRTEVIKNGLPELWEVSPTITTE